MEKLYAVAVGRNPGIYRTWEECKRNVDGFPRAVFKSFTCRTAALAFLSSVTAEHSGKPPPPRDVAEHQSLPNTSRTQHGTMRYPSRLSDPVWPAPLSLPLPSTRQLVATTLDVYVDGACTGNGKLLARGGYGGFYGDGDKRNFSLPLLPDERQTNNRGEMKAIIHVIRGELERLQTSGLGAALLSARGGKATAVVNVDDSDDTSEVENDLVPEGPEPRFHPLRIFTDSKYCQLGIMQYIKKWEQNGFKLTSGRGVENRDLWVEWRTLERQFHREYAAALCAQLTGRPQIRNLSSDSRPPKISEEVWMGALAEASVFAIEYVHVPGHAGVYGNEMADCLAVAGAAMAQPARGKRDRE